MAKTRKIPLRKSVVSNEIIDKRDLLRIVKNKEGQIFIDPTGKANGRGAYIKLDNEEALQACTAGTVQPSHVLEALYGKDSSRLKESLRISFSELNSVEEVQDFLSKLKEILS